MFIVTAVNIHRCREVEKKVIHFCHLSIYCVDLRKIEKHAVAASSKKVKSVKVTDELAPHCEKYF